MLWQQKCARSSTAAAENAVFLFIFVSQVEVERHPWLYNDENGQQVGGFVKEFGNIAFVTVKVNLVSDQLTCWMLRELEI